MINRVELRALRGEVDGPRARPLQREGGQDRLGHLGAVVEPAPCEQDPDTDHQGGRTSFIASTTWRVRSSNGPDIEIPEAFLCPPPPNCSASRFTSTFPLDRRLTFVFPSGISLKSAAATTPSTASIMF